MSFGCKRDNYRLSSNKGDVSNYRPLVDMFHAKEKHNKKANLLLILYCGDLQTKFTTI